MNKFKAGDSVVTHEFKSGTDGLIYDPLMRVRTGIPGTIIEISKYGGYRVHGYLWPESALTTYEPAPAPGMTMPSDGSVHDAQARHEFGNWSAQPQAQLPKPKYDLKEFTLAAMFLLSNPVYTNLIVAPRQTARDIVRYAQSVIIALQEAEKEETL